MSPNLIYFPPVVTENLNVAHRQLNKLQIIVFIYLT